MGHWPIRLNSLALRLIAGAGLWIAAALIVGGIVLSALFRDYVERSFDARLTVLLEGLVAASDVGPDGELLLTRGAGEPRFEQVYSGWYWQIAADGMVPLRSRSLWDQVLPLSPTPSGSTAQRFAAEGPDGTMLRIVERVITLPGSPRRYRYSVGAERREVDREIRGFNATLAWSLGLLGAGLIAALLIQVRFGLLPLRRIRTAIVAIRAGEASRLEGEFPTEIAPLSNELNTLLEHNAAVVERARTHVSNLAHALKTPLSVLTNDAAGAAGPLAESVRRQTAAMRRQVDHYLARARAAATGEVLGARTEVLPVVEDLRRALARIYAGRGLTVEISGEPRLAFRGEREDLEEMLGNLVDNACKWAASRVRIELGREQDRIRVTVDDDGPGLDDAAREEVFARGRRLDETVPGSGLGLSIVRDIAELYGGRITLDRAGIGGLRAVLLLPAAG